MTEIEKICKEMGISYTHLDSSEFNELTEMMKKIAEETQKIKHQVKVVSKEPWCALIPSEMLADCDTWILKPWQKTCRKGHLIEYVEGEVKNEEVSAKT